MSLLEASDPAGEVRMTWHAKETVRGLSVPRAGADPMTRPPSSRPRAS
jgi:hypothetical protein